MLRAPAFGLHVSVTCHTAVGAGVIEWGGRGWGCMWRVLNCICLTFWHVQHRLKITFAAEKCHTIRWRRQSVEWIATGDWKSKGRRGIKGSWGSLRGARQTKLTIDRCNRSILAQWYVELPSLPLSLPVFGRKLHFVKAFLRLLLTKQRNAWEMARNKPWQAVNMQIVFSTETQFHMSLQASRADSSSSASIVSRCRGTLSF